MNTILQSPGIVPQETTVPTYRRRIFAWAMYDWADHGFITTTLVTFFPAYFVAIASPAFLAAGKLATDKAAMVLAAETSSNIFSLTVAFALFITAIIAPIVGTLADITGRRKRMLLVATAFGSVLASFMVTLSSGMWLLGLALYASTQIMLNICLGMNSSLLPHVARPEDLNRASSLAYGLGYMGGAILLAASLFLFLSADKLGIDGSTAVRLSFLCTGIWWLVFTMPVMLLVPEPPAAPGNFETHRPLQAALSRLRHTVRDIQRYRELFKMLIAFWMYSEGISAIILLATAYGASLGFSTTILVSTILMTQLVGLPYVLMVGRIPDPASKRRSAFVSMLLWTALTMPLLGIYANSHGDLGTGATFVLMFGDQLIGIAFSMLVGRRLFASFADRLDTKGTVMLCLAIYVIIPVWGLFLKTAAEFFMVGWLAGTVQGGSQALSRTIYASMSPKPKSGEFFGLYGLSEKFAGILAPLLYGIVGLITHSAQVSLMSIAVFFVIGWLALRRVDVQQGAALARAEEARIAVAQSID